MYEYKYVKHSGEGFMSITFEGACEVIDDYAKMGYRYVGYLPHKAGAVEGSFNKIILIFERKV